MTCPICKKEMDIGRIESGREIMWRAKDSNSTYQISSKLFILSHVYAERCEDCGIVIVKEENV